MMPTNATVSVIVPVLGTTPELARAIDSALAQTLAPLEVIVVDDGTQPPIRLPCVDARVRLERLDHNAGPSAARNLGCRQASGEWVAFLDADDAWLPDKLALQLAGQEPADDVLLACNALCVDPAGRSRPYNRTAPGAALERWILVEDQSLQTSGLVLPRQLALRFGFNEQLRACEDWDLVLRLDDAGVRIVYTPECLTLYATRDFSAARFGERIGSTVAWLDARAGSRNADVILQQYLQHLFLPHLAQAPVRALARLAMLYRAAPDAGRIVGAVAATKLRRRFSRNDDGG